MRTDKEKQTRRDTMSELKAENRRLREALEKAKEITHK